MVSVFACLKGVFEIIGDIESPVVPPRNGRRTGDSSRHSRPDLAAAGAETPFGRSGFSHPPCEEKPRNRFGCDQSVGTRQAIFARSCEGVRYWRGIRADADR